jgi:AcrR family transcriptional regulator
MLRVTEATVKASPEETRTRILAATREIFEQKGFRGTTTREVADKAGVNEATLFRHFGNKEALVEAMLQTACDRGAMHDSLADATGDIERDLKAFALNALYALEQKRQLILITLVEEPRDPTGFNMMWQTPNSVFQRLQAYFAAAIERGDVQGDSATLARFFMGMLFARVMGVRVFGGLDAQQVADEYVDIFLNGIRKPPQSGGLTRTIPKETQP